MAATFPPIGDSKALHADASFIDPIRFVGASWMRPIPFLTFWRIALQPPIICRWVDRQSTLAQQFREIAIAHYKAQIPPQTQEDGIGVELMPVGRIVDIRSDERIVEPTERLFTGHEYRA